MIRITRNASLRDFNTFGLDVRAAVFAEYDSIDGLREILANNMVKRRSQQVWNIGMGSNLLFSGFFDGVILHGKLRGISISDSGLVNVAAGEIWDEVVEWCVAHNLYGAENLSAIPGEVGAAAVQNIGAYGAEFGELVEYVEVLNTETLETEQIPKADCKYGYRESIFKHEPFKQRYIVTGVALKLCSEPCFNLEYGNIKSAIEGKEITLRNVRNAIIDIRAKKLPDWKVLGNAGSFFKNPVITEEKFNEIQAHYSSPIPHYPASSDHLPMIKVPAGWLIENAGLKGFRHGGAQVYEKQCLVLVNTGNATSLDIVELSNIIINKVKEVFGIEISPEVNIL